MNLIKKQLIILTRTPLHVGAGAAIGAIDQPVQRERHTSFPIIPASTLKGCFADQWPLTLRKDEVLVRLTSRKEGNKTVVAEADPSGAAWLFGSDDANCAFAGSLIFGEAKLLAFPVRSARGSFAWITCPMMLQRAVRDGVLTRDAAKEVQALTEPSDSEASSFAVFKPDPLGLGGDRKQLVLEEYCLKRDPQEFPVRTATALAALTSDETFTSIADRLVILSNGMMSHFATSACEVAQHVCIDDETGTAKGTGLFNQENVPADSLFYSVLHASAGRGDYYKAKTAKEALEAFSTKLSENPVFQFGGDASTGLGFCTVTILNA